MFLAILVPMPVGQTQLIPMLPPCWLPTRVRAHSMLNGRQLKYAERSCKLPHFDYEFGSESRAYAFRYIHDGSDTERPETQQLHRIWQAQHTQVDLIFLLLRRTNSLLRRPLIVVSTHDVPNPVCRPSALAQIVIVSVRRREAQLEQRLTMYSYGKPSSNGDAF